MNVLIGKFAKQSGICFGSDNQPEGWRTTIHGTDLDLEKFAELIVRECISALDKEVYIATREDGEQACHEVILLEHFGVKE
jgi:hypothetical protein